MAELESGYQEDLAYIHDVGFGGFALQSAPGLLSILEKAGVARGFIVDLGCGSGLWARALRQAKYDVLGIDFSAEMIKIARARVPDARFQRGSFMEVKLPPCDAVTAIGEIFNYLFDASNRMDLLLEVFARVYQCLRPGGVFIFDVAEPGRGGGPGRKQKNFSAEDWAVLVETEEEMQEGILTRRIVSFRRVGKLYRRAEETHRLQLYRGRDLVEALRGLGFRARLVRGYGEFRLPSGMIGIVARKPPMKRS